jgi:ABC-2 type transport system ATP-binding protein
MRKSSMNGMAVRLAGVTKAFGYHTAVSELDLEIPAGTVYGLLGPNGSGKTTTIRMIMGILLPDRGEIQLLGGPPGVISNERVGYLPEERGVYRKMKVLELLVFAWPRRIGRTRRSRISPRECSRRSSSSGLSSTTRSF